MGPRASTPVRRAVLVSLLLLGARCGGGGGGGPADDDGYDGSLARIEGTILFPDSDLGMVAEREPNGSVGQAQSLPPLEPRSAIVVAGEGGATPAGYGAIDTTDAYRLVSHVDQEVTLELRASTGGVAQGAFDVTVFDTSTGDLLASSTGPGTARTAEFRLPGDAPADVVVTCAAGWGAYTLSIETDDPSAAATIVPATIPVDALEYALDEPCCVPGRVIVKTASLEAPAALARRLRGRVERRNASGSVVMSFPTRARWSGAREALSAAARLSAAPGVLWAEPDWLVETQGLPDDPALARQWHLFGIGAPSAWETTFGSSSVVVGVVDTGIAAHPDLAGQVVPGYDFVSDPSIGADGDGRDPDPTDPGAEDLLDGTSQWHGLHIAGIVAARADDGVGVAGVAPGCRVMPLRAIGRGGGTVSDLAAAIRYAAGLEGTAHGPPLASPLRVVNLALGTPQNSSELREACDAAEAAGVLLVSAAGNGGGPLLYPAGYSSVLGVGAVDGRLLRAEYSNVGPELDLAAPGGDVRDRDGDGFEDGILSCALDETTLPVRPGLSSLVGTSMATAQVSGTAALVLSVDPSLSRAALRSILVSTAKDRGPPGPDTMTGAGVLHAGDAVKAALVARGTPRTGPPLLHLSTTSLRFRPDESIWIVYAYDAGGSPLALATPIATSDGDVPWLHAVLGSSSSFGPPGVTQIHVTVDPLVRAALPPGFYAGSVRVRDATAILGSIRVVMEIGMDPLTGETLQVVAQEAQTGIVRASGFAHPWQGYRYVLKDVPPGEYVLKAGTDLDGDGFFCESVDLCGRHGGLTAPLPVSVQAGTRLTSVDIVLE
jgi:serine protease